MNSLTCLYSDSVLITGINFCKSSDVVSFENLEEYRGWISGYVLNTCFISDSTFLSHLQAYEFVQIVSQEVKTCANFRWRYENLLNGCQS